MDRFEWIATAAFGLEGVVARELARLGLDAKAENGGARFFGWLYKGKQGGRPRLLRRGSLPLRFDGDIDL